MTDEVYNQYLHDELNELFGHEPEGQAEPAREPSWWEFPAEEYPEPLTKDQQNMMTALMWDDLIFNEDGDFD